MRVPTEGKRRATYTFLRHRIARNNLLSSHSVEVLADESDLQRVLLFSVRRWPIKCPQHSSPARSCPLSSQLPDCGTFHDARGTTLSGERQTRPDTARHILIDSPALVTALIFGLNFCHAHRLNSLTLFFY